MAPAAGTGPSSDVVRLAADLIRIDTSNPTHVERPAAEYVASALHDVGVEVEWLEPAPGRASVVARIPGTDAGAPPLLVHGHLDVVPAVAGEWSVDPFGGEVRDGYVWGRGAIDMKGQVAMVLDAVRTMHRFGERPRRTLVLALFADEEAGGALGAGWATRERPDLFAGCREAIGEVGGFSHTLPSGQRIYLVSAAEKGVLWARLVAEGRPGHGSMINPDNAVTLVSEAVARVARGRYGQGATEAVTGFLDQVSELLGPTAATADQVLEALGPLQRMIGAGMRDTVNPTRLEAGYKDNVVPGRATATIDGRFLPGNRDSFVTAVESAAGAHVRVEPVYVGDAVEAPWNTPLVPAITRALRGHDGSAVVVPYLSTAFTDAKWLSALGINCYGFCPLLLPDDLDFTALFHGVDERVPVAALEFGAAVLRDLFLRY